MGITLQQFKQVQARLGGARRAASPLLPATVIAGPPAHQVLLGLDPSLRGTGYGVIRLVKPFPQTLAHGTVSCPAAWAHTRCLAQIVRGVREVLQRHRPTVRVVE